MVALFRFKERIAQFLDRHPILLTVVVLVYIVSPVDVIPEALAGPIGYLDDVLVVLASMYLRRLGHKRRSMDR